MEIIMIDKLFEIGLVTVGTLGAFAIHRAITGASAAAGCENVLDTTAEAVGYNMGKVVFPAPKNANAQPAAPTFLQPLQSQGQQPIMICLALTPQGIVAQQPAPAQPAAVPAPAQPAAVPAPAQPAAPAANA